MKMEGMTPLHLVLSFSRELKTGHGPEDVQVLVGLVHADRNTIRFKWKSGMERPPMCQLTACQMKSSMQYEELKCFAGALEWDLCMFEGCRASHRRTITDVLAR